MLSSLEIVDRSGFFAAAVPESTHSLAATSKGFSVLPSFGHVYGSTLIV